VETLGAAMQELSRCFDALAAVAGDDGQPLVDKRGVEVRLTEPWRDRLREVDEEMLLWSRAFRRRHGETRSIVVGRAGEDDEPADIEAEWEADDDERIGAADQDA
jgi:hypothetical protein